MKTYLLFEIANSCAGSSKLIQKLIDSLPQENPVRGKTPRGGVPADHAQKTGRTSNGTGIKFQGYKYNEIALSDYEWYQVYKQTFINAQNLKKIFAHAKNKNFDIWI